MCWYTMGMAALALTGLIALNALCLMSSMGESPIGYQSRNCLTAARQRERTVMPTMPEHILSLSYG